MIRPIWFVAPALALVGTGLGAYHASQDIEPASYTSLIQAWPRLSDTVRDELRHAMSDGHVSVWEFAGLQKQIMDDAGYLTWTLGKDTPEGADARSRFAALVQ